MANLNNFLWVLNLCVSVAFLNSISCKAEYFFVLGDSLYDPGNNQFVTPNTYLPNYHPPYGLKYFNQSTGRYSNGRNVADFIVEKLGLNWIMPPALNTSANFTYGASFASGGAGVFDTSNQSMNLASQLQHFIAFLSDWEKEFGDNEVKSRLAEAVFLICIGGNDYFSYNSTDATFFTMQSFVNQVIGNLTLVVKDIYEKGGRKFMFQTVAPVGCLPMNKQEYNISGPGCVQKMLTLAVLHNNALTVLTKSLASDEHFPGFTYSIFDYFTAIGSRLSDPQKYGFEEGDKACCGQGTHNGLHCGDLGLDYCLCGNATQYVFFDGAHNTDTTYNQLADLMWDKDSGFVSPYGMKDLFAYKATKISVSSRKSGQLKAE